MVILGIDPGTTKIGFGVIETDRNNLRCLDYGVIKTGRKGAGIYSNTVLEISKLIKKHRPNAAAVEKLFFFKNQKTIISVSQMRGVILFALENAGLPIHEFTPLEVKQSITNYGRAEKKQVQSMVRLVLKLKDEIKPDDAADALAIAICCTTRPESIPLEVH